MYYPPDPIKFLQRVPPMAGPLALSLPQPTTTKVVVGLWAIHLRYVHRETIC